MKIIKAAIASALILLAGCVTSPYQTAFDSCDAEAGACYRYCEDVADNEREYSACHADCEVGANQCFASAYDRYSYSAAGSAYGGGSYYTPSWPWYGRYGAWGPTNGYYFDFSYAGGSNRYGRYRGDRNRRGRYDGDGYRRGGGDRRSGAGQPSGNPPRQRPPHGDNNNNGRRGADPDRNNGAARPPLQNSIGPSTAPPPAQQSAPPAQDKPVQPPAPTSPGRADRKRENGKPRPAENNDY